mmetsp:Transcript_84473/g.273107  ORF Transcript_84473/g.273107 Transcript_84473/m.273107 type:complete len:203 (-) Transcript_84473:213-821(-)
MFPTIPVADQRNVEIREGDLNHDFSRGTQSNELARSHPNMVIVQRLQIFVQQTLYFCRRPLTNRSVFPRWGRRQRAAHGIHLAICQRSICLPLGTLQQLGHCWAFHLARQVGPRDARRAALFLHAPRTTRRRLWQAGNLTGATISHYGHHEVYNCLCGLAPCRNNTLGSAGRSPRCVASEQVFPSPLASQRVLHWRPALSQL